MTLTSKTFYSLYSEEGFIRVKKGSRSCEWNIFKRIGLIHMKMSYSHPFEPLNRNDLARILSYTYDFERLKYFSHNEKCLILWIPRSLWTIAYYSFSPIINGRLILPSKNLKLALAYRTRWDQVATQFQINWNKQFLLCWHKHGLHLILIFVLARFQSVRENCCGQTGRTGVSGAHGDLTEPGPTRD